ncbi:Na+/H+ antiporter [Kibdelosporangium philippinense]|uniref:Na+/H+ antiporter n=1 Tax=Kibdelosporangium philippinense TaxID=211113 RepID=A0ABS8ZHB5_9PSEU|nr:Na+/H+ antiporter [Kibdelosporangium philippinense]MCE7006295.1 Na+/H+ antiporter [Kibdelosporangium philippinense]
MQLLLVVVGAIAVTAIAHRRGMQPSLVVVVLAAAVSFIPGLPRFELEPELILSVVLPPLLYSAALNFSFPTFTRNLRPILALGVGMVVVSTMVTGVIGWWIVPGLALVPALILGAVVAPPDAVAGLAVGRELGLPKRLMAILTGESLVNDAAALTIFTLTVAAVTGDHTLFDNAVLLFTYSAVVGSIVGFVLGWIVHWIRMRIQDSGLETTLGLVVPFAAYLLAEEVHASGVLAVVMAGFVLGHKNTEAGFATRLQARQVWSTLDVLLEAFVFAYMGLQCRFVFADLHPENWEKFALAAVGILLTVLVVRPLWMAVVYGRQWLTRKLRRREQLPWKYFAVISWMGMRGVVTLAAAAGVPESVPERDTIQALAFVVAVGTLLIQGPTLPLLIRKLDISAPQEEAEEEAANQKAREVSMNAVKQAMIDVYNQPHPGISPEMLEKLKARYIAAGQARRAMDDDMDSRVQSLRELTVSVRRSMLAAQRRALAKARDDGELDDETVRRELDRLDYEEAAAFS